MQFVVKPTSIAHRFALVVPSPQRCRARPTIRTDYSGSSVAGGLLQYQVIVNTTRCIALTTYRWLFCFLAAMAGPGWWSGTRIGTRLTETVSALVATPKRRLRRGTIDALLELGRWHRLRIKLLRQWHAPVLPVGYVLRGGADVVIVQNYSWSAETLKSKIDIIVKL